MTQNSERPLFRLLKYCNLVELFKFVSRSITGALHPDKIGTTDGDRLLTQNANIAIDVFQVFKWSVLLFVWYFACSGTLSFVLIAYLIASNLYTYFYYQVWGSTYTQLSNKETDNRRFINSLLAIAFYITAYAYLFQHHYAEMIAWPEPGVNAFDALYLSVTNAFTLTYEGFVPLSQRARLAYMTELINTFLFFVIILTNAIPNHIKKDK